MTAQLLVIKKIVSDGSQSVLTDASTFSMETERAEAAMGQVAAYQKRVSFLPIGRMNASSML